MTFPAWLSWSVNLLEVPLGLLLPGLDLAVELPAGSLGELRGLIQTFVREVGMLASGFLASSMKSGMGRFPR